MFLAKSSIKKETVFPVWYETLTMNVELPEPLINPPDIFVSVSFMKTWFDFC